MKIKAIKDFYGTYRLVGINPDGIEEVQEIEFKTKKEAYKTAKLLWPANSVWHGRRVHGGYRIDVD
jgi:hypothetical protein